MLVKGWGLSCSHGFSAGAGWLGGSAGLVINSVTLGCSMGIGLLAQVG
jgi:hypothetical protein